MNLKSLETICNALALSQDPNSIDVLKSQLREYGHLIQDQDSFYHQLALSLSISMKPDSENEEIPVSLSQKKMVLLRDICPMLENDVTNIIQEVIKMDNGAIATYSLFVFCDEEHLRDSSRSFLINHLEEYLDNLNIVNFILQLKESDFFHIMTVSNKIADLKKQFENHEISQASYSTLIDEYMNIILRFFITHPNSDITFNQRFIENIFSNSAALGVQSSILRYIEKDDLLTKSGIDKAFVADFLIQHHHSDMVSILLKSMPISVCERMERFKDLVAYMNDSKGDDTFTSYLELLYYNIQDTCVLAKCFPDDVLKIVEQHAVNQENSEAKTKEIIDHILTVMEHVDSKNLPCENYYESFVVPLLEKDKIGQDFLKEILTQHDIDFSYAPISVYGPQPLSYWIATSASDDLLKVFLEKYQSSDIFVHGPFSSIPLCSLYFRVGNIEKGMKAFTNPNFSLFSKDYLDDLSLFQKVQLGFEASFDYSDNLTQIVSSIVYSEHIQNKQEILLEILNSIKIHVVPVSIFTMLESCLDSDHLKEIYENFKRREVLFTSNFEDRVSGQVLEIRIADEDKLSVVESLWHSKQYQK